jgi:hypothetical protein
MTLGEARHSGKAIFPECNTWGRRAHKKEKVHLTATLDGAVRKKLEKVFPECHALALGEGDLFPECFCRHWELFFIFCFFAPFFCAAFPHYLKLLAQI